MIINAAAKIVWGAVAAVLLLLSRGESAPFEAPPVPSDHGRVLEIEDSRATAAFIAQPEVVRRMVAEGMVRFTAKSTVKEAWQSLVSTQDVIGIKVHSSPGASSGTRPAVVAEVVRSLIDSGWSPEHIVIWDRRLIDLRLAGYTELAARFHVQVAGALEEGYDPSASYNSSIIGRLVYGDLEFLGKGEAIGKKSYVTKLLTRRITKIISITPLLNHNDAGVTGALYGLAMSSVDNTLRFEAPDRLATAVPEIYALPEVGDKVVLNIVDALLCQYRGEERTLLHYSTPLNQLWFSTDPVAVDVLGLAVLERQRADDGTRRSGKQIYANAGLMDLGTAELKQIRVERVQLP